MRVRAEHQASLVCLVSVESRVAKDHPLRKVKQLTDAALMQLNPVLTGMYSPVGRKSIPPESLGQNGGLLRANTVSRLA